MSIEYTIDIQLTELGFPDLLQPGDTSVRAAPRRSSLPDDSLSPTVPAPTLTTTHKERLLVRGNRSDGRKETGASKQAPGIKTEQCQPFDATQSTISHDAQAHKGTAAVKPSDPTVHSQTAAAQSTGPPQPTTEQGDCGGKAAADGGAAQKGSTEVPQGVDDDSDDSEVSETYEEEEVDEEDDDDEEGLNNESGNSGDYRCSVCERQFPSKFKLQDHMNLHTGARPYCCAECGKRFCQIYNYRVHLRTHAKTKVDLMCRVCLMNFGSQQDLRDHLSGTHLENEFYECDLCKRVFTCLKECEYHVQIQKCMLKSVCEVCGNSFSSPKSLARHRRKTCRQIFKCTDCTKTFTKKNALLKHSFSHVGLLPYTCVRCHCHFRLAKLYLRHKCEPERIHCVACLRMFLSQEDFQQHKKDTGCWGNQDPKGDEIRCLECGQRFDTSEELKKHAGAHQRVLKCADCGKGFRSALLLMSHMGGHAGQSPCLCQSCGLGFPHQQNYDSHLKTCGKTPQPASAPKKRQGSKISSHDTKKLNTKPTSSNSTTTTTTTVPVAAAAAVKDSRSPGLVKEDVSAGSARPEGVWKLTLDKQPPPGVKLVLFLPVCPSQTSGPNLPPARSPTLPGPAVQVRPQHLGVNAARGELVEAPLNLVTGIKQDQEFEAPLDLSKKCKSLKSVLSDTPPLPVKSEPEEFEISGEADDTKRQEFRNGDSKAIIKPNPEETNTEVKNFKTDPMDLFPGNVNTTSSGITVEVKNEPQSPGLHFDSWSSRSCQLTDKEIKMEVDISSPAAADRLKSK